MDVIPDEDFDRLWDEAVAEAAKCKIKKQHKSHSSNREVDPLPKTSKSSRSSDHSKQRNGESNSTPVLKHRRRQQGSLSRSLVVPCISNESSRHEMPRRLSSKSLPLIDEMLNNTRSKSPDEMPRRRSSSISRDPSLPFLNEKSNNTRSKRPDEIPRPRSSSFLNEMSNITRSKSPLLSRSNSDESSRHEMPRRRSSSFSRVPSLPSPDEMPKYDMHGLEGYLSALSYLSALGPPSNKSRRCSIDESMSSLFSGFSEFESVSIQEQPQRSHVSENRQKRTTKTRSKSRSPSLGSKKQQSNVDVQREGVKHILESESSERLLFEIPATFEVKGHKETRNQSTGLVLSYDKGNETGAVVVKEISPSSLFASTRLKSGHEILMINNHRVKSPRQAAKIMKSLVGNVTIYCSEGTRAPGMKYVRVKVGSEKKLKGSPSLPTTSSLSKSSSMSMEAVDRSNSVAKDVTLMAQNGLVQVAHVDPDGAFRKNLKVGDVVIAVNGTLIKDDEEAKEQLLDTANHEVVCMLIYSMADLCMGLIQQLLPGWKSFWASEVEVTLSREDVLFSFVWRDNWVCECTHSDAEAVYNSDIQPALEKINWAISLVISSLVEASGVMHKQSALDVDCNPCTATTDPTPEQSTGSNDEIFEAGSEPKESRQKTVPSPKADTDDAHHDVNSGGS
jgi:hypothetical protein